MDSSSFDEIKNSSISTNEFPTSEPILKGGATSDSFKVRIHGKWHFLKRPKLQFAYNPIYIAAFEKEFDLGFTLDHPNIVRYLNKGSDADGFYILTEFVDGLSLSEFRLQHPDYFNQKVNLYNFARQLFSALSYLHARQIVHLDLKPDNILITRNGNDVKLIDLGMSYSDCYSEITGGSTTFGSPEQFSNPTSISFRCDMFAASKVLLFAVVAETNRKMISKIPQPLRTIVKCCMITDFEKRTITADKCLEQLNPKNKTNLIFLILMSMTVLGIILFSIYVKDDSIIKITAPQSEFKRINNSNIDTVKGKDKDSQERKHQKLSNNKTNTSGIEARINQIIKNRISPNKATMDIIYSSINEYNYDVLLKAFNEWKVICNADCKQLYANYKDSIEYSDFKSIYQKELQIFNQPFELKFKAFKDSISN
jgi:serine/threonine protein kinase